MTLASPVGTWSNGKYWLVDHTLLLPSQDHPAFLFTKHLNITSKFDFYQTATYFAQSDGHVPLLVPAKFSMVLGQGPNSSAPFPYVADTALPKLKSFQYKGTVFPTIYEPSSNSGLLDPVDLAGKAFVQNTGSLPIWGVATASSAFAGAAPVFGHLANEALAYLNHADITPWSSRAPDGASFVAAEELIAGMKSPFGVSRRSVDAAAADAIHGVIDGGYSDGTGLGIAVASGAQEVLLVLNSGPTDRPFFLEILCKDGPRPANPMQPTELYPLFETTADAVQKQWLAMGELILPNAIYLKRVIAGSFEMTTARNQYFGIAGGRNVTLHLIHVCASLNIGFFEKYVNFGSLAQEITSAISADVNRDFVNQVIMPMLMGPPLKKEVVVPLVI
jgi:hypothetical protein